MRVINESDVAQRCSTISFDVIGEEAVRTILGISRPAPLAPETMAHSLRVTFFPVRTATGRVRRFAERLRNTLAACGVTIVDYDEALVSGKPGKVQEGIVIIAPGELQTGDLPVDHVTNLRTTTVLGIIEGPCPADGKMNPQEKLNAVVQTLAWSLLQAVIYVDESSWSLCTMNGAIVRCVNEQHLKEHVLSTLIPKLAAPVVPPHSSDFEAHEGALDLDAPLYKPYIRDYTESAGLWANTGLMLFHTSLSSLEFRDRYYKRLAAAYLDNRSGMSYGFLARQLPSNVKVAMTPEEFSARYGDVDLDSNPVRWVDGKLFVPVHPNGATLVVEVPEVRVLTTRSGCNKSQIDARRDLILMRLHQGRIIFETPQGISMKVDSKPSYDTLAILAHAVGNAIVVGILSRLRPEGRFVKRFLERGMALAHWHGYINTPRLPEGYFIHGATNPPVSCSTHQAAIYTLAGKLSALDTSLRQNIEYLSDVHIEPHHGTNISGSSLVSLAKWVLENIDSVSGTQTKTGTLFVHDEQ